MVLVLLMVRKATKIKSRKLKKGMLLVDSEVASMLAVFASKRTVCKKEKKKSVLSIVILGFWFLSTLLGNFIV